MRQGSLTGFNPRNTGLYEARLWQAYYDRRWLAALVLLFRLLRSQFSLGAPAALRATYWGIRAAIAWAPVEHDRAAVGHMLNRFYRVVRAATGADFDADAAGAAELEYWVVHRDLSGQQNSPELVESLAGISAVVYGLSRDRARPSAVERAHACDLVDAITAGKQAPTPEAWEAIATSLRRSYGLLRAELDLGRAPAA